MTRIHSKQTCKMSLGGNLQKEDFRETNKGEKGYFLLPLRNTNKDQRMMPKNQGNKLIPTNQTLNWGFWEISVHLDWKLWFLKDTSGGKKTLEIGKKSSVWASGCQWDYMQGRSTIRQKIIAFHILPVTTRRSHRAASNLLFFLSPQQTFWEAGVA